MDRLIYAPPRRWCPNCESPGIRILWGYLPEHLYPLIESGQAVLGGCEVTHDPATHLCQSCGATFSGTDRRYVIERGDSISYGIGVWPHGRRSVRIEIGTGAELAATVEGVGSILVPGEGIGVIISLAWSRMSPAQISRWASARGFPVSMARLPDQTYEIRLAVTDRDLILLAAKQWWRTLGRNQFADAVDDLESHGVNLVIHNN